MGQRQRHQRAGQVVRRRRVRRRAAPEQVGVGQRHALGPAGRAAGVQQRGQVVVGPVHDHPRRGRRHLGKADHPRPASPTSPINPASRPSPINPASAINPPSHPGPVSPGNHDEPDAIHAPGRALDLGQELGGGHHRHRARVGQRVPQLVFADQEDQRRHHRPGPPGRVVGDQHLRAVGHQHHQPVAGPDPQPGQAGREPGGLIGHLAPGVPAVLEEERVAVTMPFELPFHLPGQVLGPHARLFSAQRCANARTANARTLSGEPYDPGRPRSRPGHPPARPGQNGTPGPGKRECGMASRSLGAPTRKSAAASIPRYLK